MMTIVGHLTLDEVILRHGTHHNMGGVACYAALAAKLLELDVKIISKVGADFPKKYLDLLKSMGIDVSEVQIDPKSRTTSFRLNYLSGERELELLSHAGNLSLDKLEGEAIYLGPVAWEIGIGDIRRLLREHKMVTLDPQGLMRELREDYTVALKPINLRLVNLWALRISREEARILSKSVDPKMMVEYLKNVGAKILILTLGAKGAIIHDGKKQVMVPCYRVPEVDPTGAGDAFGGAFIAEYINSKDVELAAAMGSAAASLVVEEIGFQSLLSPSAKNEIKKRAEEIYELIEEY